ncbi:calcium-binding protein, partial [Methylomonas sp. MgM2]
MVGAGPAAVTRTYIGDQRAPLIGIETDTDVAPTDSDYNTYKWGAVSWQNDGTLGNGVAEADFNDVITGSAQADKIDGLGGNDALDGGVGDDQIDGGTGDDLIGGGAGSDVIHGGDGRDEILSATGLIAPQRTGPNDIWQPPAGKTVWIQGNTWGVYDNGNNTQTINGGGSLALDNAPDVVFGDGGDDDIIGGHGDDYLDGGADNDALTGNGGHDLLIGGSGNDFMRGDGTVTTGYYSTTPASPHGKDFLDGGAGSDLLIGDGNDDILLGGADNDTLWGDASEGELALQYHGNDYLDGGAGDDTLYGNGGDDILIGGGGNDELYGGEGFDTYIINAGDGIDHIIDNDPEKNSKIIFGVGVNPNDITLELGSLMLDLGNGNAVHIENFDQTDVFNSSAVSQFQFADGTVLSIGQLLARGFDLDGSDQNDTIIGTNTTDRIDGGLGADYLAGGAGDDTYLNVTGEDTINDTEGRSTIKLAAATGIAANGLSVTNYGEQNQYRRLDIALDIGGTLKLENAFFGSDATLEFANGNTLDLETLVGSTLTTAVDLQLGDSGGKLYGGAGDDTLKGGAGDDTLSGHQGDDTLNGGAGDDLLLGGAGNDNYIVDGNGTTHIRDHAGSNHLQIAATGSGSYMPLVDRQSGDVIISKPDGSLVVIEQALFGTELSIATDDERLNIASLREWAGTNVYGSLELALQTDDGNLYGGASADHLAGRAGANSLWGGGGDDHLEGDGGGDTLYGDAGNDTLMGGAGDDTLVGGSGNDVLIGGAGADAYLFGKESENDVIPWQADAENDRVVFGAGIQHSDVRLTR